MNASFTIDCYPGSSVASTPVGSDAVTNNPARAEPSKFHFDSRDSAYKTRAHFEAAETDRLNEAHWQFASEIPVNDDLHWQLPRMRGRANYEAINNPTIEGLMLSHTLAVVGEDGPLLDLHGDDEAGDRWCNNAEEVWENWCKHADAAGQLSLGSLIKQWNTSCWRNGEFLEQFVTEDPSFLEPGEISLRLHGVEPQRLISPSESISDPSVVMGIRRNRHRRPLEYWISDTYINGYSGGNWIKARNMLHGYDLVQAERGQARGIPWCNTGLPISADLRDYDLQVLDAARSAADMNIVAFTRHPDAEFADNVPTSVEYRRRMINHLAPGWEAMQTTPAQPGAQYKDHRQERMGDLGKGRGVPSMITRLDARDHNYSSARFDYQLLGESAKHVRATLYNPLLRRLVWMVLREAQLLGKLGRMPSRIWLEFVWPALPEIDELKSAEAEQLLMQLGTLTYTEACATRHGRRSRDQARRRQRDERMLSDYGLPGVQDAVRRQTAAGRPATPDTGAAQDE